MNLTTLKVFLRNFIRTMTGHAGASRMSIVQSKNYEGEPAQIQRNCNMIIKDFEERLKVIEANNTELKIDDYTFS